MIRFRSACARLFLLTATPSVRAGLVAAALLSVAAAPVTNLRADSGAPGSLDTSFNAVIGKVTVYAVAVDSQQRVVFGGDGGTFERVLPSGIEDSNFSFSAFGKSNRIVFGLAIDRQDRIYTVGAFDPTGNNNDSVNITRFDSDGSRIGRGFEPDIGANDAVISVLIQPTDGDVDDDLIVIGGLFRKYRGEVRQHLVRIQANAMIDRSFDGSLDFDDNVYALAGQKDGATGALNGQIVVGGAFTHVNGNSHAKLARLNFDGSVDESFQPDIDDNVLTIDVQPDGKIVIGGQFGSVNGNAAKGIARLNPDGSYDSTFSAGISGDENKGVPPEAVFSIKLQADGKMLVGGNFLQINGEDRRFLGRLNIDGSVDEGFVPGTSIINRVESVALQADNKVVVGEVVSKKVGTSSNYPNVVKRVYGDPVPPVIVPLPEVTLLGGRKAVEGGQKGYFIVNRAATDISQPLTVFYQVKQNAHRPKSGVDYRTLSGTVVIPAGRNQAAIKVIPTGATLDEPQTVLKLTLIANGDYDITGTGEAQIKVVDAP